jgi:hypothetical protein
MTELTNKYYFDMTVAHIRNQGEACMTDSGLCVYRSGERTCAIGYWIPKGHKSPSGLLAEDTIGGIHSLRNEFPELEGIAWPDTEHGISLAMDLQNLHDADIVGTESFELNANKIEFDYGYDFTE